MILFNPHTQMTTGFGFNDRSMPSMCTPGFSVVRDYTYIYARPKNVRVKRGTDVKWTTPNVPPLCNAVIPHLTATVMKL
jgi:hypothetical protein